jgi:CDP-diacylglycerol--glycerol-3-phosphate 3-phosphatidyltransferase
MQDGHPPAARAATLTDRLRGLFKGVLDGVGGFLTRLGVSPNAVTLTGLVGSTAGAVLLALGFIPLGGLVVLLSGATDAIDGTLARLQGKVTRFGAFLDSTSDRYADLFIFGALGLYYAAGGSPLGVGLSFAAAIGSVMVSYTKARAEALGFECKVGLLTRVERYLVICPLLILNLPLWAAGIVAVLGNFTALQRVAHVHRQSGGA